MNKPAWLALLPFLSGCAHYTTFSSMSSTEVGARGKVPFKVVTGEAVGFYILTFGPFGNDSPNRAIADARGRDIEGTLTDVQIERKVWCLPVCQFPLFMRTRTIATGSLVRPSRYADRAAAEPKEPAIDERHPDPSARTLAERLQSLHGQDPEAARAFYVGLRSESRGLIRDYILAQKGVRAAYGDDFKIPAGTSEAEKKFLGWFLREFTAYQPVYE